MRFHSTLALTISPPPTVFQGSTPSQTLLHSSEADLPVCELFNFLSVLSVSFLLSDGDFNLVLYPTLSDCLCRGVGSIALLVNLTNRCAKNLKLLR